MRRSIRWQIAVPFILLLFVAMGTVSLYVSNFLRQSHESTLESGLIAEARTLADSAAPLFTGAEAQPAIAAFAGHSAGLLGARVTIIQPDGAVLADTSANPADMENHLLRPEVAGALAGRETADRRYSTTLETNLVYAAAPIRVDGRIVGALRLALPATQVDADLRRLNTVLLLATLVVTLAAAGLALLISNYTVRPVRELTRMASRFAAGKLEVSPQRARDDEVGDLYRAFDRMASQLSGQIGALQTERGKLEAVLGHMTDGVLIVDRNGRVQLINPAAEDMFRINAPDALGHSLVEVVRHYQIVELWKQCKAGGAPHSLTLELNAERLFLQVFASSLEGAMPGSVLLLFQDLTRVRRLEMVRRDFVSNVSHELRTPLASLKALAETLDQGALEDPPAARRFIARMETEIDTLSQMIQELLELSRIESGKVPLEARPIAPHDLLAPAVERMRMPAERAGLSLRLDCPEDLPAVAADAERIVQVLANLLHNAVKFTPPGGEIQVTARSGEGEVIFAVRDTGVGIPADDLPRIFERFYKADRARSGGGTGLGLSIAKHVIDAHGGRIWAESEPGQGSVFSFALPLA